MPTTARPAKRDFRVVGTRPIRHDGNDKVTGRAQYGADVRMPSLLHGAILRSPHAHARIKRIDTSRAEAHPDVHAVVTSADLPEDPATANPRETVANMSVVHRIVLARGKVTYKGHAVAAVAAANRHAAEEALNLIRVEYEQLPHVLNLRDAMAEDAPLIDESLCNDVGTPGNVAAHLQFKQGDVAQGFGEADVIVEREFETLPVHQGYIEPQNSTAYWGPDGQLTIWKSTQGPFMVRAQVASLLNIPVSSVKVIPMEIGGGFGGKASTYLDAVTAMLSKKSGRPVKIVMTREEVFVGTGPAAGSLIRAKIGATKDGRLTAGEVYMAYEAGGFPGSFVQAGMNTALAPYRLEHLVVDGYDVLVNKPKATAYRAPGAPQVAFAVEQVIDEVADGLGMDPMDLRLKNVVRTGDRQASGMPFPSIGGAELEQAMKAHPHYTSPISGRYRGRGVATGYWQNGGHQSSASLSVNSDGTVTLQTGSVDIGGTRVGLAIQVAEVLGITAEQIHPTVVDTDSVGFNFVTGGSRTAFASGIAVIKAAENIRNQMIHRAALLWETEWQEIEFRDGVFASKKNPEDRATFKDLASHLMGTGGPVTASASTDAKGVGPSFAGMIADVEVDPETGKVEVLRCTIFQDAGQAVHPSYVEGQMQGGAVQGIGWALNEGYVFDNNGSMLNSSFLDYRLPTTLDLPMIEPVVIEVPNPGHPFGVRGVGEASLIPPMAAIANAIAHAIGKRVTKLPMSPGTVLELLEQ